MSWNPLRKFGSFRSLTAPNRESVAASTTAAPARDNSEFDEHVIVLSSAESSTKRILKDARKMSDAILSLNRAEVKLTNDLSNSSLCQLSEADLRSLTEEWHSFNCKLTEATSDLHDNVSKVMIEPCKKLLKALEELRNNLRKREENYNKILKLTEKVAKLKEKEKTGNNLVNLQKAKLALSQAEEEYNGHNLLLLHEMPAFVASRVEFLQPSVQAYMRSKVLFWGETLSALTSYPFLSEVQEERVQSWQDYQAKQESLMKQLSGLSIVEGDS